MVGNVAELVDWWGQAGKVNSNFTSGTMVAPWPKGYGDGSDATWNVNGVAHIGSSWINGSPATAIRGGHYADGTAAGEFALLMDHGPASWSPVVGARCCRR